MIVGITDGKGMTDKVSTLIKEGKFEVAKNIYANFFKRHTEQLNNCAADWIISKTTGDGLFFYTRSQNYKECLLSLVRLFNNLNKKIPNEIVIESRLFFFYCVDNDIINGNSEDCFDPEVMEFTKKDIFGHQLNYGFRLLSLASGAVLFTEQNFILKLLGKDRISEIINENLVFEEIKFSKRIPITYLKGITECGFTYERKEPKWIWEIIS